MKRSLIIAIMLAALLSVGGTRVAHAAGGGTLAWGWGLQQWWTDLGYTGEVWRRPNLTAMDHGVRKYCSSAWLRFYAGSPGNRDTGKVYAVKQLSDPRLYQVIVDYWDDFSWDPGYVTHFTKGFTLVKA